LENLQPLEKTKNILKSDKVLEEFADLFEKYKNFLRRP
jgi:hypothetical protein